jgi:dTDP-4-dehydrorhamnose 3,5-epimerase
MDSQQLIDGIHITELQIIPNVKGDILHALKSTDKTFDLFGEAYFTTINKGCIKGWKKHSMMLSNLIVPVGEIKFVFYDQRIESPTKNLINIFNISINNYKRITVEPNIWFAFEGVKDYNLLMNISNILHDPNESENLDLENKYFSYNALTSK